MLLVSNIQKSPKSICAFAIHTDENGAQLALFLGLRGTKHAESWRLVNASHSPRTCIEHFSLFPLYVRQNSRIAVSEHLILDPYRILSKRPRQYKAYYSVPCHASRHWPD